MLTQQQYNSLIERSELYFCIEPDGRISRSGLVINSPRLHIISGSFNPLHIGHKRLYVNASQHGTAYFEISITRDNKLAYPLNELNNIIKQFAWYAPVIITNAPTFAEKSKLFTYPNLRYHIGVDTAARVIRDYTPTMLLEHNLHFCVYNRDNKTLLDIDPQQLYKNMYIGFEDNGAPYLQEARCMSSTRIRNEQSSSSNADTL